MNPLYLAWVQGTVSVQNETMFKLTLSLVATALYQDRWRRKIASQVSNSCHFPFQLNWHKDDREGRFLLRRIEDITNMGPLTSTMASAESSNVSKEGPEFKRKLSKREKKEIKKQEKLNKANRGKDGSIGKDGETSVAEKLYTG